MIIGGLVDAMQVVEEDLAEAVSRRRESLEHLGSRYQDHVVDQELVPLIREQIWPIVKKHAEPLANQVGEEMFERASLWRFGWRFLYDRSPLPEKNLTRAEWNRFVNEEGIPVLNSHASDILAAQRLILEEVANNELVRDALAPQPVAQWSTIRSFARSSGRSSAKCWLTIPGCARSSRNAGVARKRGRRSSWRRTTPNRACAASATCCSERARRESAPEFAQVLRNQILDKDCRWLVLETPAAGPLRSRKPPAAPCCASGPVVIRK